MLFTKNDAIVALSTPQGSGAIAVIRLSGNDAINLCDQIFFGKNLSEQQSHTIHFGIIKDENGKKIDEVLISIFKNPHSYTGEDICEISCHCSNYIISQVINLLIRKGAKLAKAGEFTLRAFLNGKLDLSQAEAVADIIASDSEASHRMAMQQMRGGISLKLKELRTSLVNFAALIELELDFAEEDVEFADRQKLNITLNNLLSEINTLIQSFAFGNAIKNGIKVAIVGRPNAGKSSWINALMNDEVAIVSDIAGTTRDRIETSLNINGIQFRLVDTAGIRNTEDVIEKIGVQRAFETIEQAEIILHIFDITTISEYELKQDVDQLISKSNVPIINIANKSDLVKDNLSNYSNKYKGYSNISFLSVKDNENVKSIKNKLYDIVIHTFKNNNESVIISNSRHLEALEQSKVAVESILEKLNNLVSTELITQDIKSALYHLGTITGEIDIDKDILETIFSKFCIGK
jgi:tRNA modification GTPase